MRNQQVAFAEATNALLQLGIPDNLSALRGAGVYIKRQTLGGSHSVVTYPPLHSLRPIPDAARLIRYGSQVHLYLHIPFCETLCTFCHYVVNHYRGKQKNPEQSGYVARYLEALEKEMRLWAERLRQSETSVSSIYIGGGTPMILETDQLLALFRVLQSEFSILPEAEICVEGSPLTITAEGGDEKLRALAEMGVTRLSFGIQSFNDEVLKDAARGYRRDTAWKACELAASVFSNWNIDLIQSLSGGSNSEVWDNLLAVAELKPSHLTWYHGRFDDKRPQGKWVTLESRRSKFEDEKSSLLGRMLIWREMEANGYTQVDGNRFVRDIRFTDPFKKVRTSVSNNSLGLGTSSYSHVDMRGLPSSAVEGLFFRNIASIQSYIECVEEGGTPIGTGRLLTPEEWLAASYVVGLRTGRVEGDDIRLIRELEPALSRHYEKLEETLLELKVFERNGDKLSLSRLGQLFEDEVLSLFYSPSVQESLR